MNSDLYIALIHSPVLDRNKKIITSSVTNLDLHDIARSARTFGVKKYFVVHPSPDEQALNRRILSHWHSGYGQTVHSTRGDALQLVELVQDFETVAPQIERLSGSRPLTVGTHAKPMGTRAPLSMPELQRALEGRPCLLLFGTGYGLTPEWEQRLDLFLEPIYGASEYNHLSVRSAVAIYLDRWFSSLRS